MHPLIQQKAEAVAKSCRQHHVQRLEVFGSAARGIDFDAERSDVDLLVTFQPSAESTLKAFFDLRDELSRILGHPVDLAEASALRNPYLLADANQSREVLYAA